MQVIELQLAREMATLENAQRMVEQAQERRTYLENHPDEWLWKPTVKDTGEIVDFAVCRPWVGESKANRGKYTWHVYAKEASLDRRVKRLNRMSDTFDTLVEAKEDIEEVFADFNPENRQMLQGERCPCLQEYYAPEHGPKCQEYKAPVALTDEEIQERKDARRQELMENLDSRFARTF